MKTFAAIVLIILMTAAILAVAAVMDGWVLSVLWSWFVVPVFHAPKLPIPYAIGITFTVGTFFIGVAKDKAESGTEPWVHGLVTLFLSPLLTLFFGYIVHLFV